MEHTHLHKGEVSNNCQSGAVDASSAVHVHPFAHGKKKSQLADLHEATRVGVSNKIESARQGRCKCETWALEQLRMQHMPETLVEDAGRDCWR